MSLTSENKLYHLIGPTNTSSPFNLSNLHTRCSNEPHNSLFETLPHELLQQIAHLLPTSAASSLALCNKHICSVVGSQYWTKLRSEPLELESFLGFFEKDNPDRWLCRSCRIFHHHHHGFRQVSAYNYVRARNYKCVQYENPFTSCVSQVYTESHNIINHWMVQMAMTQHRLGPDHGLSLNIFSQKWSVGPGTRGRYSTEARIVANALYLRYKYNMPIHSNIASDYYLLSGLTICQHIINYGADEPISLLINDRLDHRDDKDGGQCKILTQCRSCHTEFEVEAQRLGATWYLVFTSWKNLGSGIAPRDPKWLQHVKL